MDSIKLELMFERLTGKSAFVVGNAEARTPEFIAWLKVIVDKWIAEGNQPGRRH